MFNVSLSCEVEKDPGIKGQFCLNAEVQIQLCVAHVNCMYLVKLVNCCATTCKTVWFGELGSFHP